MRYLADREETEGMRFLEKAAKAARKATCLRAHCGTVIVKDGEVIGEGYNSPPLDRENRRTCMAAYELPPGWLYDRTCCMHAEWRAILDALKRNTSKLPGSRLYFVRVNEDGSKKHSSHPYCTVCSRMALDTGIAEFVLWQDQGLALYDTAEYDELSYKNLK